MRLKPCPFCGDAEIQVQQVGSPRRSSIVSCTNCGAQVEANETADGTGEHWNRRPIEDAIRKSELRQSAATEVDAEDLVVSDAKDWAENGTMPPDRRELLRLLIGRVERAADQRKAEVTAHNLIVERSSLVLARVKDEYAQIAELLFGEAEYEHDDVHRRLASILNDLQAETEAHARTKAALDIAIAEKDNNHMAGENLRARAERAEADHAKTRDAIAAVIGSPKDRDRLPEALGHVLASYRARGERAEAEAARLRGVVEGLRAWLPTRRNASEWTTIGMIEAKLAELEKGGA